MNDERTDGESGMERTSWQYERLPPMRPTIAWWQWVPQVVLGVGLLGLCLAGMIFITTQPEVTIDDQENANIVDLTGRIIDLEGTVAGRTRDGAESEVTVESNQTPIVTIIPIVDTPMPSVSTPTVEQPIEIDNLDVLVMPSDLKPGDIIQITVRGTTIDNRPIPDGTVVELFLTINVGSHSIEQGMPRGVFIRGVAIMDFIISIEGIPIGDQIITVSASVATIDDEPVSSFLSEGIILHVCNLPANLIGYRIITSDRFLRSIGGDAETKIVDLPEGTILYSTNEVILTEEGQKPFNLYVWVPIENYNQEISQLTDISEKTGLYFEPSNPYNGREETQLFSDSANEYMVEFICSNIDGTHILVGIVGDLVVRDGMDNVFVIRDE